MTPTSLETLRARLEQIKQEAERASKAPWKADVYYIVAEIKGGRPGGEVIAQCRATADFHRDYARDVANAAFIASSRSTVPRLVEVVEQMAEDLNAVASWLQVNIREGGGSAGPDPQPPEPLTQRDAEMVTLMVSIDATLQRCSEILGREE